MQTEMAGEELARSLGAHDYVDGEEGDVAEALQMMGGARAIDGLSIRYAESEPRDDRALLPSLRPESIYRYEPT